QALALSRMAGIYSDLIQYEKSISYHHRSLQLTRKQNHRVAISVNLNNLASVYRLLNQTDSALFYIRQSLIIKKEIGDSLGMTRTLTNLGLTFTRAGQLDSAERYLTLGLEMATSKDLSREMATALTSLCELYVAKNEPSRAVENGHKALALLRETPFAHLEVYAYSRLSKAYVEMGEHEKGMEMLQKHIHLKDSLLPRDLAVKAVEKEAQLLQDKQQVEIELLEAREDLNLTHIKHQERQKWWFGALLGLSLILVLVLYSRYRTKMHIHSELKSLDKAKSRFFANLSHEFRTPLTLIIGPLEQLQSNHADQPQYRRILHNARRLLSLNEQLLELAKIESGVLKVQAQTVDVVGFTLGVAEAFQAMADQKQINFQIHCPKIEKVAGIDSDKLEKIINNLLANALQYTPRHGEVHFVMSISDQLHFSVSDTGQGISPEDQIRIFERYFRPDKAMNHAVKGAGIGLSLVRELVQLMGGQINLHSQPDQGSTFQVTLPFLPVGSVSAPIQVNHHPATLPEVSHPTDCESPLVLVVEDHTDIRRYIREQLEGTYRVIEAANGQIGLKMALEQVPDLIISDLMMPGLDGLELCQQLKSDERSSHIPIILLTAIDTVESRIQGLETGADDYLAKPFHSEELLARSRNLISQRRKLRELFHKQWQAEDDTLPALPTREEVFFKKVSNYILEHITDTELSVERLGDELAMSRVQLFRKLKAISGQSPSQLIRKIRLQKAAGLLGARACNVSEAMYATGFENSSYFAKVFRAEYGCKPSEYLGSKVPPREEIPGETFQ
ncbi:MAG: response regulator, partial [Bacteroidota bacterium]